MTSIQEFFQQAQLAEAAYSNFLANPDDPVSALISDSGKFSPTQAAAFVEKWRVIDQYTAPSILGLTGSGFSATVFRNTETGQYVFAVRGTEPTQMNDLLGADLLLGIGNQGIALQQALDLYNYRKSLETPVGQAYQAAYLESDMTPEGDRFSFDHNASYFGIRCLHLNSLICH